MALQQLIWVWTYIIEWIFHTTLLNYNPDEADRVGLLIKLSYMSLYFCKYFKCCWSFFNLFRLFLFSMHLGRRWSSTRYPNSADNTNKSRVSGGLMALSSRCSRPVWNQIVNGCNAFNSGNNLWILLKIIYLGGYDFWVTRLSGLGRGIRSTEWHSGFNKIVCYLFYSSYFSIHPAIRPFSVTNPAAKEGKQVVPLHLPVFQLLLGIPRHRGPDKTYNHLSSVFWVHPGSY